jgi:hypothetical protein
VILTPEGIESKSRPVAKYQNRSPQRRQGSVDFRGMALWRRGQANLVWNRYEVLPTRSAAVERPALASFDAHLSRCASVWLSQHFLGVTLVRQPSRSAHDSLCGLSSVVSSSLHPIKADLVIEKLKLTEIPDDKPVREEAAERPTCDRRLFE